ncbi:Hypothetical predicted protein [Cloeon dipterum]|uniref:Uncharacterized protein n=1 Tax=Cloeon dipterum TaxID=197152 RepID=A0A8S1C5K4_9INSE|nr:Hypothetical predicted protein [Cloeon dipterum]
MEGDEETAAAAGSQDVYLDALHDFVHLQQRQITWLEENLQQLLVAGRKLAVEISEKISYKVYVLTKR